MLVLCSLILAALVWLRIRERREIASAAALPGEMPSASDDESRLDRARRWSLAHRWELFVAACFVAYLTFPFSLNGATLVYQRWFPPAYAVLAVVAGPRDLWVRRARVVRLALAAPPIATRLLAAPGFVAS